MKSLVVSFLLLLTTATWAQTISNYHVEAMKSRYETRSTGQSIPADAPANLMARQYEPPTFKKKLLNYKNWKAKYEDYFLAHYGDPRLTFEPDLIVMHYTVTSSADAVWRYFNRTGVSVHLMVDKDGTIYRLLPLDHKCNGAYGVNHRALSIEMVASTETDLLSRSEQVFSSFCLVKRLMERYNIPLSKVYAHYEVSEGKSRVPEYLDLKDKVYPDRYPPVSARSDPGRTYMSWLRAWLRQHG